MDFLLEPKAKARFESKDPVLGLKSEALNPKSETISNTKIPILKTKNTSLKHVTFVILVI